MVYLHILSYCDFLHFLVNVIAVFTVALNSKEFRTQTYLISIFCYLFMYCLHNLHVTIIASINSLSTPGSAIVHLFTLSMYVMCYQYPESQKNDLPLILLIDNCKMFKHVDYLYLFNSNTMCQRYHYCYFLKWQYDFVHSTYISRFWSNSFQVIKKERLLIYFLNYTALQNSIFHSDFLIPL